MITRRTLATIGAGLAIGAGLLGGAASAADADRCAGRKPYLIYYATHAIAEPVWATVKAGATQGAADNCLRIKWTQDQKFSIETTINRMETAISEKPDLLVFTATDPTSMRPTFEKAKAAGIPVIAINSLNSPPKTSAFPISSGSGPTSMGAESRLLRKCSRCGRIPSALWCRITRSATSALTRWPAASPIR